MSIKLYMDVHIRLAVTDGLRLRGVDILTAQEDGAAEISDPDLLDRATIIDRVLITHDKDFLREAAFRQIGGLDFAGVIFASQTEMSISQFIEELELIAKVYESEDLKNRVEFLPLK